MGAFGTSLTDAFAASNPTADFYDPSTGFYSDPNTGAGYVNTNNDPFNSLSDTATMPFPSTSSTPSQSAGSLLSGIGSALAGVGQAAQGIFSGESTLTLAQHGLTPGASQTYAQAGAAGALVSSLMPILLIGALLVGGIVLLRHASK